MTTDRVGKVARDLTEILRMYAELEDQAINDATSPLMPGGRAMVELGPVANLERWGHMNDATERLARAYTSEPDEDPEEAWSAFQLLEYWSEEWRRIHGAEYDQRPTITSEANFLRFMLNWARDNEPRWEDFEADVNRARIRLEDILTAGKRTTRGVQCLDCRRELVRIEHDRRNCCPDNCLHDRGGLTDTWRCPGCDRRYDRDSYFRAVHHAHLVHADYLTLDDAAARTDVKPGTIKVWANRGKVRRHRAPEAQRMTYCVADIEAARDAEEEVAS